MSDCWNPSQYHRFQDERSGPFYDLLALVEKKQSMRAIDLGCGTGELTQVLHRTLGASSTLGTDSSPAMLEKAKAYEGAGLQFKNERIQDFEAEGTFDLIFSNAALHWIDHHAEVIPLLARGLAPGGQIAIQMPANHDHPSHRIAAEVANQEPFRSALGGYARVSPVLPPERYAVLLDQLGFAQQHVRLQVYLHHLDSRAEVIEWVKGTLLTDYQKRMDAELYRQYLEAYRKALFEVLDDEKPYRYPFKRVLLWARK